jgi:hypothetical protein
VRSVLVPYLAGLAVMVVRGDWHDCGPYACPAAPWMAAGAAATTALGLLLLALATRRPR